MAVAATTTTTTIRLRDERGGMGKEMDEGEND